MQFVGGVDALEIDVQDQRFVGALRVAQQDLFLLAVDHQVEDGEWKASFLSLRRRSLWSSSMADGAASPP